MAVRTGVDMVAQIIDSTSAGAASVERSVRGMGDRVEKGGDQVGKRFGANLAGAIISGLAAAGIDRALEQVLVSQRTGENIATSLLDGIVTGLRNIPVAGALGELITRNLSRALGGSGLLPGEESPELLQGREETQRMQQRQRREAEIKERYEAEMKRRAEQQREAESRESERRRQEQSDAEERRLAQEERLRAEQQREAERLAAEQQRESERLADLQRSRAASVAGAEDNLAGVVDSRGLSGRAAAFRQGRTEVGELVAEQKLSTRIQKDMAERLRQIAENLQFTVVGN